MYGHDSRYDVTLLQFDNYGNELLDSVADNTAEKSW